MASFHTPSVHTASFYTPSVSTPSRGACLPYGACTRVLCSPPSLPPSPEEMPIHQINAYGSAGGPRDQPVRSGRTLHSSPSMQGCIWHHHFWATMEAGGGEAEAQKEQRRAAMMLM
ncbi:hypothetical protein EYF80_058102 [Liparis tanakae]|uniref:Uncharacterized protein n=1 Tax=Liparis tanakae TaxID=230148 RepID=A0A4Z2ET39_9TELE|nr:hypothetical protein EYF80_058102 [Liparis tanakae]